MAPEELHRSCETRVLCRSEVGTVMQCIECGQVQLALSYLTIRLEPAAFRELTGMLALALQRLPEPAADRTQPMLPGAALH